MKLVSAWALLWGAVGECARMLWYRLIYRLGYNPLGRCSPCSEGCKCFSWLDGGNVGTHWWVLRGKP